MNCTSMVPGKFVSNTCSSNLLETKKKKKKKKKNKKTTLKSDTLLSILRKKLYFTVSCIIT